MFAAAGIMATGLVVGTDAASTPAQAADGDRVTAQWNMNGQSDGSDGSIPESRWQTQIRRMLNDDGVDIASLQEAGNEPPPMSRQSDRRFPEPGVTEHLYNIGTRHRPDVVNIYWADPGQQRNGLALVSRETARDAVQLPVGGRFNSRPMMGVQFGDTWYFNAHALANGPGRANDAADIVETARQYMARTHPGGNWMVLADFNRTPGQMPPNLQNHIVASDQPTHQGGGELDFAYMNNQNNSTVDADRRGTNSDHNAYVRYVLNANCGSQIAPPSSPVKRGENPLGTTTPPVGSPGAGAPGVGEAGPGASTPPQGGGPGLASPPQAGEGRGATAPRSGDGLTARPAGGNEEDCYAPVPGETYRVVPQHLDGAVLTADVDRDGNAEPPLVKKASGSDAEKVQVRFGSEAGTYLLAFDDDTCLSRLANPAEPVTDVPCDPGQAAPTSANWKFLRGQIVTPDLGGTLQPSPNELGARLKVQQDFYQWGFEPVG